MTGTHAGHIVFNPRMALTTTKDCHLPFTLIRRQGHTLTKVGIYLPQSVFTHGQLYVAMS